MNDVSENIARRAYELFLSRGAQHGRDVDDWLEAERQLTSNSGAAHATRRPASRASTSKTVARQRSR